MLEVTELERAAGPGFSVCALAPEDKLIATNPTPTPKLSEEIIHLLQQRSLVSNGSEGRGLGVALLCALLGALLCAQ